MGIRGRLLVLALVVAVPLALVGVADMRGVWRSNRAQLDEALRRVVCSLIENAIKYTPEGGRIRVGARASRRPGSVDITVSDTGVGILTEDLPLVFEKFFRGRPAAPPAGERDLADFPPEYAEAPGVGLGLYLARSIVGQLGGSISAESPPPGEVSGTVFTVRLPLWRDEDGDGAAGGREYVEAVARG